MNEPTVNRKDWIERWQSIEAQSRKAITQHMSQRQMNQHCKYDSKLTKDDALFVSNAYS